LNPVKITVLINQVGKRLDILLSEQLPTYSRSFFKRLIADGQVMVNQQKMIKSGYLVRDNDAITITFPVLNASENIKLVQDVGVKILYEHSDFLIIFKPAGLVVHAPKNDYAGVTLVDWLVTYFTEISTVGSLDRPGIVHRLDMHTSGIMVIPRNNHSHAIFTDMFKNRQISKTYLAIVSGHPAASGTINYHIVRHPTKRNIMTHVLTKDLGQNWNRQARESLTNYEVLKYLNNYSLVAVKPVTGRTHQIRVHMAAIGHTLVGDTVYGYKNLIKPPLISRQALHAHKLEFVYQGQPYVFTCEAPDDFTALL